MVSFNWVYVRRIISNCLTINISTYEIMFSLSFCGDKQPYNRYRVCCIICRSKLQSHGIVEGFSVLFPIFCHMFVANYTLRTFFSWN